MPIPVADIGSVTEASLQALVGIAESQTLEFKRDTYGSNDRSKQELCKDVSGLANTNGGDLVLGMQEANSAASAVTGINCQDVQAEIQRLQNIVSMAIEPPVSGLRFHAVSLQGGKTAIVIRVPQSMDLPHRVT